MPPTPCSGSWYHTVDGKKKKQNAAICDVLRLWRLKISNENGLPAGGWWLVTKRRYMRCSGHADAENAGFRSPPTGWFGDVL